MGGSRRTVAVQTNHLPGISQKQVVWELAARRKSTVADRPPATLSAVSPTHRVRNRQFWAQSPKQANPGKLRAALAGMFIKRPRRDPSIYGKQQSINESRHRRHGATNTSNLQFNTRATHSMVQTGPDHTTAPAHHAIPTQPSRRLRRARHRPCPVPAAPRPRQAARRYPSDQPGHRF